MTQQLTPYATAPHGRARRRDSRAAYTLIELLSVMGIVAVMLGIGVAAYTSIARASSARKAADNLEAALSLARQYAVTKNMPVLFLLLDKDFNANNSTVTRIENYGPTRARHYAIFDPSNRVYLTGWTELPPGVVLDSDYASSSTRGRNVLATEGDMFFNRNTYEAMIPFPSSDSVDATRLVRLPGIGFKSDGTVFRRGSGDSTASYPRRINVAEGTVDAAGAVTLRPNGKKYGVKVSLLGNAAVEEN